LDGRRKPITSRLPDHVFVYTKGEGQRAPISFYRSRGSGREFYKLLEQQKTSSGDTAYIYLYAGHRLLHCEGCGAFHERTEEMVCTACGGRLVTT
jgi:hypothetical protein